MPDRVSYLGIPGSYSYQASSEMFPESELIGFPTWSAVLGAVESGRAQCAVVPVENALTGRIEGIYQALSNTKLNIIAEYILPVDHCLLAPAGKGSPESFDFSAVKAVYSHQQGFLQCAKFLERRLPHAELIETTDTAKAAQIASTAEPGVAAISSKLCATLFTLDVVAEDIADEPGNATRFLVMSKEGFAAAPPTSPAVTTLLFRLKHYPGALVKALAAFSEQGINLTKLETYMLSRERQNATFYVDVGEHLHSDKMKAAIPQFAEHVEYWKVLGTYKASPLRGVVAGFLPT